MGNVIDFNERKMAKKQNSAPTPEEMDKAPQIPRTGRLLSSSPTREEIDKALQEAADYLCRKYNFDREKVLASKCIDCESKNDGSYVFHFVSTVPPKRRGGKGIFVYNNHKKKVWLLNNPYVPYKYSSWTKTQMDFYRRKTRKSKKELLAAEIESTFDLDQFTAEMDEMFAQLEDMDLSLEEAEELYMEIKEILGDDEEAVAEPKSCQRTKLVIHNKTGRISNSGKQLKNPRLPKGRK